MRWLAALLCALACAPLAHDGRAQTDVCAVTGRFVIPHVRLRTVDGVRPRRPRFVDLDVDATLLPAIDGRHELSGSLPDGHAFTARLRALPALEVAGTVSLPGVTLGAGVPITDVRTGSPPGFDVVLGPGVTARDLPIPCASIAPVGTRPRPPTLASAAELGPARLSARPRLLLSADDGTTLARIFLDPATVLHERELRGDRVRVAWSGAHARVEGWVDQRDLLADRTLRGGRP